MKNKTKLIISLIALIILTIILEISNKPVDQISASVYILLSVTFGWYAHATKNEKDGGVR